jgi:hypothetical protein
MTKITATISSIVSRARGEAEAIQSPGAFASSEANTSNHNRSQKGGRALGISGTIAAPGACLSDFN